MRTIVLVMIVGVAVATPPTTPVTSTTEDLWRRLIALRGLDPDYVYVPADDEDFTMPSPSKSGLMC